MLGERVKRIYSFAIAALVLAAPCHADVLLVDTINDGSVTVPKNGASKAQVVENFGEPGNRQRAVGDPPISSWGYASFRVYFEYDRVLHSVVNR